MISQIVEIASGATATAVSVAFVLLTYVLGKYESLGDKAPPNQTRPYKHAAKTLVCAIWVGIVSVVVSFIGMIWCISILQWVGTILFVVLLLVIAVAATQITGKTFGD